MELIKRYKGYNITIKGLRVEANNGIDFIILTVAPIKNKSSKYINIICMSRKHMTTSIENDLQKEVKKLAIDLERPFNTLIPSSSNILICLFASSIFLATISSSALSKVTV